MQALTVLDVRASFARPALSSVQTANRRTGCRIGVRTRLVRHCLRLTVPGVRHQMATVCRASTTTPEGAPDVSPGAGTAEGGGGGGGGKDEDEEEEEPWTTGLLSGVGVGTLGAFLFGYHSAVINAPLASLSSDLGFADSNLLKGTVVSIMVLGGMMGGLALGPIGDRFGRRGAFLINAVPLVLGAALSAVAQDPIAMVAGRGLAGVGVGASSALVPLYLSEISPPPIRGQLNGIRRIAYVAGCLGAFLFAQVLVAGEGNVGEWWRPLFVLATLPGLAMGVAAWLKLFEESPVWLLSKGREDEARAALIGLQGVSDKEAMEWQEECKDAAAASSRGGAKEEEEGGSWASLMRPENRRPVVIGLGLCTVAAFSGSNTIIFYASAVFERLGLSSPYLLTLVVGLPNMAGAVGALKLTDLTGRRPLLLYSFGGMAATLALLATSTALLPPADPGLCQQVSQTTSGLVDLGTDFVDQASRLAKICDDLPTSDAEALAAAGGLSIPGVVALVTIPLYIFAFSFGAGPIPWLIYNEIFPTSIRATATSLCTACNYAMNAVVGLTFLPAVSTLGLGGTYGIYTLLCAGGYVFVDRLVFETKGKSLSQIEMMMAMDQATAATEEEEGF